MSQQILLTVEVSNVSGTASQRETMLSVQKDSHWSLSLLLFIASVKKAKVRILIIFF